MRDPSTVIGILSYPWEYLKHRGRDDWKRAQFLTLWHEDPETDGTDDSCDWFWRKLSTAEVAAAHNLWDNELDNLRPYLDHLGDIDRETLLECQWRAARRFYAPRPWYRHPRWHVLHWRAQVHPLLHLKRWLFSRCATCGKRFPWGYAPITTSWNGGGPRWFKGERDSHHHECHGGSAERVA